MTQETFKPFPEDTRYSIGDHGSVIGARGHYLSNRCVSSSGYLKFALGRSGGEVLVHRAVAYAHGKMTREQYHAPFTWCVDHLNGDKADNRLENLEVVTYSQNGKRYYDSQKKKEDSNKLYIKQLEDRVEFLEMLMDQHRFLSHDMVSSYDVQLHDHTKDFHERMIEDAMKYLWREALDSKYFSIEELRLFGDGYKTVRVTLKRLFCNEVNLIASKKWIP